MHQNPPPFYASVDIRNSGYRITPIDTNLFPAGFNNLHQASKSLAVEAITNILEQICPNTNKIILIPENHHRNYYYFANLWSLQKILQTAGVEVRICSINNFSNGSKNIQQYIIPSQLLDNQTGDKEYSIEVYKLKRRKDKLYCEVNGKDFVPSMILLNNDLSSEYPEILKNIDQPINPPPQLGWHSRFKSKHFEFYHQISSEFCEFFEIPKNLLQSDYLTLENINFHNLESLSPLFSAAKSLMAKLDDKFQSENNPQKPYLVIKADAGTYGMAVMAVKDLNQLQNLNRKARNKLAVGKEGLKTNKIILQEGIHSIEYVGGKSAEPVIYLIGNCAIGGFYRVHPEKGDSEILNSPGMQFHDIPFDSCCNYPDTTTSIDSVRNQRYVAGIIARLAALASAMEIEQVKTIQ